MKYEAEKLRGKPVLQEIYLQKKHNYSLLKSTKPPLRDGRLIRLTIIDRDVPVSGPNKVSMFDPDDWN